MDWMGLKAVSAELGLEKDALHVYAAFVIQLAAAFLLRRSLASWLPWLAVLAALLVNEYLDLFHGAESVVQSWQLRGSAHDIVNTMLLPTGLLFLTRLAPAFLIPEAGSGPAGESDTRADERPDERRKKEIEDGQ